MNKQQKENYSVSFKRFMEDGNIKNTGELSEIMDKLHRYETTLSRIHTIECERDLTDNEVKQEERTTQKVKEIAEKLGFNFFINGDPRGFAIRFYLPSKRYNSWDGETWGIDW